MALQGRNEGVAQSAERRWMLDVKAQLQLLLGEQLLLLALLLPAAC